MVQGFEGVVNMIDVYETSKKVEIIMEFIKGGELFDKIIELEYYSEKDAAALVKQICQAVSFCHSKNIVHRDIKPENLMFADEHSSILKLIDFGVSAILRNDGDKLYDKVGTKTYMAPEIVKNVGYDKQCDVYGIGVIMYILLCGYPPFDEDEGIVELDFPSPDWDDISEAAIKIIKNLLSDNPDDRLTVEQLLALNWVNGDDASEVSLKRKGTIASLIQYNTIRKAGASMNMNRPNAQSNNRVSIYGMFGMQDDKSKVKKDRGAMGLSDEDLSKKIKSEMRNISDLFDLLTEDLMALSLRGRVVDKKKVFFEVANDVDDLTTQFKNLKSGFIENSGV